MKSYLIIFALIFSFSQSVFSADSLGLSWELNDSTEVSFKIKSIEVSSKSVVIKVKQYDGNTNWKTYTQSLADSIKLKEAIIDASSVRCKRNGYICSDLILVFDR